MCLKNKIISGLLILALAVAILPAVTKAAEPSLADLEAQINGLKQQIVQLQQKIETMRQIGTSSQTTGGYIPSNSEGITYSSTTYQNPSSCPAPSARSGCSNPYTAWAKNPSNGDCCQYASTCLTPQTGNWIVYSTQEACQTAATPCLVSGDSCCQNGKCIALTNTCTHGTTPYVYSCLKDSCVPVIRCSAGKTVVAADCNQECKSRGFDHGSCVGMSSYWEGKGMENPYDQHENIIGKTTDCINDNLVHGAVTNGFDDYCGCQLAQEDNVPFGQPGWLGMNSACEALCKTQGYNFGSCHLLANDTNMVCSSSEGGDGYTVYAGTTNVCKPGADYAAGCCCFALSRTGGNIKDWIGNNSGSSTPATKNANGQSCKADSDCSSGVCNSNYCVPDKTYCGGVMDPMYFANGWNASNQWFNGVCRNGSWKTSLGQIGCDPAGLNFACDSGTCVNNKCVASTSAGSKANGQQCQAGSECKSGVCSYTYCVPDATNCGGVANPMYFANGATVSNQWFGGVCRNGVWKTTLNNIGCDPKGINLACDSGTCVNNKCVASTSAGSKANGQQCASNAECSSGNCSYTYCAPAGYCGGVKDPMYFANGATASNQWFNGVCRNGSWKTSLGQIGCDPAGLNFACDSGTCVNNKCQ